MPYISKAEAEAILREVLPSYRVEEELGSGAYGAVFAVRDGNKQRAVKIIPLAAGRTFDEQEGRNLGAGERLTRDWRHLEHEAQRLKCPQVVEVYDYFLVQRSLNEDRRALGHGVVLMERWPHDLEDYLLDHRDLAPDRRRALLRAVAEMVEILYRERDFLFEDLKPKNVLVREAGEAFQVVVGDVGGLRDLLASTSEGGGQPTLIFEAPEVLRREQARADERSLIFTLGLVGFVILQGRHCLGAPLGEGVHPIERLQRLAVEGPDFAPEIVSQGLEREAMVIRNCLEIPREKRYPSLAAVLTALDGGEETVQPLPPAPAPVEETPAEAVSPEPPPAPLPKPEAKPVRRGIKPRALGALAAVALLGAGALVYQYVQERQAAARAKQVDQANEEARRESTELAAKNTREEAEKYKQVIETPKANTQTEKSVEMTTGPVTPTKSPTILESPPEKELEPPSVTTKALTPEAEVSTTVPPHSTGKRYMRWEAIGLDEDGRPPLGVEPVTIDANRKVWVQLWGHDEVVKDMLMQEKQRFLVFQGDLYKIIVGNAAAVSLYYKDVVIPFLGPEGKKVNLLSLSEQSLREQASLIKGNESTKIESSDSCFKTAVRQKGTTCPEPRTKMEFVWIPADCFTMGSPKTEKGRRDNEGPIDGEVCVKAFWMGKYEVTNEQYREWKKDHDSGKVEGETLNRPDQPVVRVSWTEATEYAEWLSGQGNGTFRLPTEAEWEYAARGGTKDSRFWGDDPAKACEYANVLDKTLKEQFKSITREAHDCNDTYAMTAPVHDGKRLPNPFSLYDMLGNVWEWTCSLYADYDKKKHEQCIGNNRADYKDDYRVLRGSSWSYYPEGGRAASRYTYASGGRDSDLGFRLVRLPQE